MKKVISILLVLCVAASLFAAVTVKAGFDFGTVYSKSVEDKVTGVKDAKVKTNGVGFDVAVIGDVASNLAVYGDVSGIFPIFFKFSSSEVTKEKTYVKADAYKASEDGTKIELPGFKASSIALRAGALYKMNYQGVDLGFGGGLVYNISRCKASVDKDLKSYMLSVSKNFGLSLYATGTYNVAKNVGVNLTINPDIYLYNYTAQSYKASEDAKEVGTFEAYGVSLGFAFNASLGVAFSF